MLFLAVLIGEKVHFSCFPEKQGKGTPIFSDFLN